MRNEVHTFSPSRADDALPHAEEGTWCWCSPRFEVICPTCHAVEASRPQCWACGTTGWIEVEASEVDPDACRVIIHNREASPD